MLENINLAFQGVWSHKLRSFLTMLGIIIGIAAIITIVSTIQGTNEQIKQNLIGAGNNVVRVTIGATDSQNYFDLNYSALPEGIDPVTREMRDEMEKLGSVSLVSMYYSRDWCDNVYVGNTDRREVGKVAVPGREPHRRHHRDQRDAVHRGGCGVLPVQQRTGDQQL